jgi:hypothetical protein
VNQPEQKDERKVIYSVSAAVRIPNGSKGETRRHMPFFSCPRVYSDEPQTINDEPRYVQERFEEPDLLPTYMIAIGSSSVQEAFDVIFGAHRPQDTSMRISSPAAFNEREELSAPILISDDLAIQQFVRGYGNYIDWILDPASLQDAKFEIGKHPSLASSKVIGVFSSVLHPHILFHQENIVGVYSLYSKERSLLSQDSDFFEAGIEYSTYNKCSKPITAEPLRDMSITDPTKLGDAQSEILKADHTLSSNISITPHSDQPGVPRTSKPESESPSFFSPTFTDHLPTSSSHHDPRIHTINIPIRLTTPTRSHSYHSSTSSTRTNQTSSPFSIKGRSHTLRNRQASEAPPPNIKPILPDELENLKSQSMLLVDIRAFPAYSESRLIDAINICIPSILLKRPNFSLDDISKNIISQSGRDRFAKWKDADGIVIYDADSLLVRDSYRLTTLATKFIEAGFERAIYGLIGSPSY